MFVRKPIMPGRIEFFSSSPLACNLSGLPSMNKEEDEPILTNDQKKKKASKAKQRPLKNNGGHGRKDSITEQSREYSGSFKEVNCSLL
ncbi:hypothetical protein LOK49_LG12G00012 [Camellia lanceoleosa]|uniref:Uncharacterized protein n=1 Tax=Camellia lanceoleosa TaxID=1840588 RepID=A0ACC0FRS6_9ERIC|nr:hypothetical protein LOK49_LG12G00012 [Camellia lanceoleosa]